MALASFPFDVPVQLVSLQGDSGADLSAYDHRLATLNSSGNLAVPSAGGFVVGVIQDPPAANATTAVQVMVLGVSKCEAGSGGVTAGDLIKAASDGTGVTAAKGTVNTSDAGAASDPVVGSYVIGIALTTAAANKKFALLITHAGVVATTAA